MQYLNSDGQSLLNLLISGGAAAYSARDPGRAVVIPKVSAIGPAHGTAAAPLALAQEEHLNCSELRGKLSKTSALSRE